MINYTDTKALDRAIRNVLSNDKKLGPQLHECLVACAHHAVANKDASRMTNLFNGLSNAINKKNGISIWITTFTSLHYTADKAGNKRFLGKEKEYSFDTTGEATPFYAMPEVEKANTPFDLYKLFTVLVDRAAKKSAKGELPKSQQAFLHDLELLANRIDKPLSVDAPTVEATEALKVAA